MKPWNNAGGETGLLLTIEGKPANIVRVGSR